MKNIFTIIVFLLLISCSSNDDVIELLQEDCNCVQNKYQVTPQGLNILRSSYKVVIPCVDENKIFNQKYNGTKLIEFSQYRCN